ncbi:MAG: conjugal transfer protein TraX [Lachnospiraceae bacterium]|nr:conjugal transfer protein TraX [Lachnospiraceae bacterium]
MKDNKFEITGAALKWIAIITMVIDHIGATVMDMYLAYSDGAYYDLVFQLDHIFRSIGRLAFPIFIFLMVEGFFYTHDRRKYFLRMLLFSIISEIPFDLAFNQGIGTDGRPTFTLLEFEYQNVFFTLTLGFLTIWLCETITNYCDNKMAACREAGQVYGGYFSLKLIGLVVTVVGLCVLAEFMETDYNSMGVLAIFVCYLVKKMGGSYQLMMAATVIILILLAPSELPALVDVALVVFYRGSKGKNINKWFFYLFYPLHLAILGIIDIIVF